MEECNLQLKGVNLSVGDSDTGSDETNTGGNEGEGQGSNATGEINAP